MDCSMLRTAGCFTDSGSKLLSESKAPLPIKFRCGNLSAKPFTVCSALGKYSSLGLSLSRCHLRSRIGSREAMAPSALGLGAESFTGGEVALVNGEDTIGGSSAKAEEENLVKGAEDGNDEPNLMTADELKALLVDGERKRLVKKLSEANQHNRFLKRELQRKDEDLINVKNDLALLEAELQDLVKVALEVVSSGVQPGTRKINGKYIQSYLASKLETVRSKLQKQIEGVDLVKLQEVTLRWVGMAESVQVMGSFDGWSQGEDMSPEYDGCYARFITTLKLRPGKYEIKFLVDGEWHLSPELPTTGEGLMENNLLVL